MRNPVRRPIWYLALFLAVTACTPKPDASEAPAAETTDVVEGTGTVRRMDIEGGFYIIRSDDGTTYDPRDLPQAFNRDGLRVRYRLRVRPDLMGTHQVGPIVDVLEIAEAQ